MLGIGIMLNLFLISILLGTNVIQFESWRVKHNKTYNSSLDRKNKFLNWFENSIFIKKHNLENNGFTLAHNKFSDIKDEWKERNWKNSKMSYYYYAPPLEKKEIVGLPEEVDWRKHNLVTDVKDQQQCGSCWAFSAVGSMEGQHAKKSKKLLSLSESQIIDCDVDGGDEGCDGGWMDGAFQYVIKQGGLETEKNYPYEPTDESCLFNKSDVVARFSSFKDIVGGEAGLKEAVATIGPISVAIDASMNSFQLYKEGVYYDKDCSQSILDHGVLVVGYGTTKDKKDYWIVKNSWGKDWGENGYILMSRNRNNSCGIATKPSYPIV